MRIKALKNGEQLVKVVRMMKASLPETNVYGKIWKKGTKRPLRWEKMRSKGLGRNTWVMLLHLDLFQMAIESYWWFQMRESNNYIFKSIPWWQLVEQVRFARNKNGIPKTSWETKKVRDDDRKVVRVDGERRQIWEIFFQMKIFMLSYSLPT